MSSAHTCARAGDEVAGVRIPRTPMAIDAAEAACASLPQVITDHACRVFVLASLAARRAGETLDADALYVAAMYANMGLSTAYGRSTERYELDSADAAQAFLLRHQTSQRMRDDVWRAIALHTTPGLSSHFHPIAALTAEGVMMDLVGLGYDEFTEAQRNAVEADHPRSSQFPEELLDTLYDGIKHRPGRECL